MADLGLSDAMDAAEPLLDAVGVPGQVVVDHQVGALEVDPLPRGVGREQDLDLRVVQERRLRLCALFPAHAAVDQHDGFVASKQLVMRSCR